MTIAHDYPELAQLLAGYLHQDYAADHPTALDAVRAFVGAESRDVVRAAAEEVDRLRRDDRFRRDPDAVLAALGCEYDPRAAGILPAAWIDLIGATLTS